MTESETEQHDRKVSDFWAKTRRFSIYDIGSIDLKNDDGDELPYEPTAVIAKAPPNTNKPTPKRFSIFDLNSGFCS